MTAYPYEVHDYDVVVVGAGGAGLRATLGMAEQGLRTACVTKVFPTRSHTVAAQGGIAASLGNMGPDSWQWHMYDTVKGSDWLGDTDAMEYLAREAPKALYELEHYGCRFRAPKRARSISARSAGTRPNSAKARRCSAPVPPPTGRGTRSCTHAVWPVAEEQRGILHRYFALDLIITDGACTGVVAVKLDDGTMHVFNAKMVVLATGGYGRAYFSATSAHTCTGDGGGWWPVRPAAAGHGVRAVPPDRHLWIWLPDHRRRAGRGRVSDQPNGERFIGTLCAALQGSCPARLCQPLHDH